MPPIITTFTGVRWLALAYLGPHLVWREANTRADAEQAVAAAIATLV